MVHTYDEHTEMKFTDVTFFPSASSHGYTLFAASTEHSTVLQLDLVSGKVQLMTGLSLWYFFRVEQNYGLILSL